MNIIINTICCLILISLLVYKWKKNKKINIITNAKKEITSNFLGVLTPLEICQHIYKLNDNFNSMSFLFSGERFTIVKLQNGFWLFQGKRSRYIKTSNNGDVECSDLGLFQEKPNKYVNTIPSVNGMQEILNLSIIEKVHES